jgi:hypothetical protein
MSVRKRRNKSVVKIIVRVSKNKEGRTKVMKEENVGRDGGGGWNARDKS